MINLFIDIYLPNSVNYSRRTWYQPIDDIYLLNIAVKSSSCTGTRLNWRRNSKKQADRVEGLTLSYIYSCLELRQCTVHSGPLKARLFAAQSIMVRWKRRSTTEQSILVSEAKNHGKISIFRTFLLYLDYELLIHSLRSLRSNNISRSNLADIL